ncbi:hypothetical protein [Actinophytocola sp.]|uniref:hypothetical protein n=1 Tax=Actinophytocola sp. TaxID=1872138 RepID=UPI002ED36962
MYVNSAVVDDNLTFVDRAYGADDLTSDRVAGLVRMLDGDRHTLVTLSPGGEAHMAIGGGADTGLVVYTTSDNLVFHRLRTGSPRPAGTISLFAGGQPGDYDSHYVATIEEALVAATRYAERGELADEFHWDTSG